jgi:hypothetical protein
LHGSLPRTSRKWWGGSPSSYGLDPVLRVLERTIGHILHVVSVTIGHSHPQEADMKRTDSKVDLNLYAALFKDIAAWDSGLHSALEADLQRLRRIVTTRGIPFIMIDMPEAGRLVDFSLSRGHLSALSLPKTFGKVKSGGSREFLSCLFEQVFDNSGDLFSDVDTTAVYFLRQVLYLAKKVRKECSDASVLAEVVAFRTTDERLRNPVLDWDCDTLGFPDKRLSFCDGYRRSPDLVSNGDACPRPLLEIMDRVSARVITQFAQLDWREIEPRHGPGAVADARTGTDKYLFPSWPDKLDGVFPFTYFAQSREDLHFEVELPYSLHEPPSRLIAVPKTLKGPRMIASEPIAHQFIQLGLMEWLRHNLPHPLRTCIDFRDQAVSQRACIEASLREDQATVDLSSASDRLSCWVVERVFQTNPSVLRALHASRTRWLVNSTRLGEPFFIKLKKFAPMGSGVTFPVQSIVYACMAIAAVLYEDGLTVSSNSINRTARKLRVFGDDIIMPSRAVHSLALLMAHCELKVNAWKTHYEGRFRESCGMDAYNGVDVTPLYLRDLGLEDTAEGLASWVDVSNNAYSKGLWALSDYLVSQIPPPIRKLIPISKEDLGCLTLRTFQTIPPTGKTRFHSHLHRMEVLGLSLEVKSDRRQRESHQSLLQYFVERPTPLINWSAGWTVRNRVRLRKRWVPLK